MRLAAVTVNDPHRYSTLRYCTAAGRTARVCSGRGETERVFVIRHDADWMRFLIPRRAVRSLALYTFRRLLTLLLHELICPRGSMKTALQTKSLTSSAPS